MEKKFLFVYSFLLVSILILYTSTIVQAPPVACRWQGYANISGVAVNSTNHTITSYTNGSQATNGTIFSNGFYVVDVPGTSGDNITFKICGVDVNQSWQTFSCGGVGYNTLNLSINTTPTGSSCTYNCGCTSGYCVHGTCRSSSTYCGDGYCDSGESCSSCSSDCGSCAAAAAEAGAGGAAAAPAVAVVEETKTLATIIGGTQADVTITKSADLKIEKITVEVKNTVTNVKITVKESSLPSGANLAISTDVGATYKYLEITKTNIQDADINKAKIKFKVDKTWINNNNIDSGKVTLQRYSGGVWNKLTTSKVDENATYVYYEAESPGLSVFAITGEKKVTVAPPACVESWSCTDWSECVDNKQTRTCTDANKCGTTVNKPAEEQTCVVKPPVIPPVKEIPTWIIGLIVVVIIGALVWWKKRQQI